MKTNKMNTSQNDQLNQKSGSMLKQKTNEDYNKEQPNPNDPNLTKGNPIQESNDLGNNAKQSIDKKMTETKNQNNETMKTYTCTMHPEVISDEPGKCNKCGMELLEKK